MSFNSSRSSAAPSHDVAISVRDVSKCYTITHNRQHATTLGEAVMHRLRNSFSRPEKETFWALKNVSFDVRQGDVVGIIGRNGAGKSTLLKILSSITDPTTGEIDLYGPVGSLLEVGTGFHPELTGRENIFLNGTLLGMKRREIERQFDAIVGFAEVERFLDTPVKRYSSGMYVRLAFAVAAYLNPEILIIDEVLAVGDAAFQKKCLGKMEEVAEQEGRTVLFVSHNMTAVQNLCRRVVWLNDGKVAEDGPPGPVISKYLNTAFKSLTERVWDDIKTAPGNDKVRLRRLRVRPENGSPSDDINVRTPLALEFEYWNLEPGAYLNLSLHVFNEEGVRVFNTGPVVEPVWYGRPFPAGLFRSVCRIPGDLLNDGTHSVQLLVIKNEGQIIFQYEDALIFDVLDSVEIRGGWLGKWEGAVRPNLEWSTELVETGCATAVSLPVNLNGVARGGNVTQGEAVAAGERS
jgi:lipopolysaccharide transport system ATP-binding protein